MHKQSYLTSDEQVLEFIRLGMDFHIACLASELTEDEEDRLSEDERFQRKIRSEHATLESQLLTRHNDATKKAESRGTGMGALQWRLEKINPKKYGNKDSGEEDLAGKVVINVIRGKKEDK